MSPWLDQRSVFEQLAPDAGVLAEHQQTAGAGLQRRDALLLRQMALERAVP